MNTKQVVIVTGSSSGIGEVTALTLARNGYTVIASMRDIDGKNRNKKDQFELIKTKEMLELYVEEMDVTQDRSVQEAVERVLTRFGSIDIVVNNAGLMPAGITEGYSLEQIKKFMETNFYGSTRVNKAVLPTMRKRRQGLLIQVSSLSGGLVFPFYVLYCATKAAVEALAEGYRYELSHLGVDSVIVEPGHTATRLIRSQEDPENRSIVQEYGEIAEMARRVVNQTKDFLESGEAQDPQLVADEIMKLIQMPTGERPLRTIPGTIDLGLPALNISKLEAQRIALEAVGMKELM
jgi:NAD(P)-dependent dehydrogenase (short-subunit alcohol dehydrogenase family)